MKTRPKLRLFRYLLPVVIVLALIFSVRYCGKQEKPSGHPRVLGIVAPSTGREIEQRRYCSRFVVPVEP